MGFTKQLIGPDEISFVVAQKQVEPGTLADLFGGHPRKNCMKYVTKSQTDTKSY